MELLGKYNIPVIDYPMKDKDTMLLKVALNGTRTPADHPAIPMTPAQQAREAKLAVAAGAGAVHVHIRNAEGKESLAPDDLAATLPAIRAACPGVPVGISTGEWIVPDVPERLALISAWNVLPDFVSVNMDEPGAVDVAKLLLEKGVGVEAGVWDAKAGEILLESGLAGRCLRVLIEPGEEPEAPATILEIEAILDKMETPLPRLLHGSGATAWEFIKLAAERGYDTRVGFEDVLTLPDGSYAESNAALVAAARGIISG